MALNSPAGLIRPPNNVPACKAIYLGKCAGSPWESPPRAPTDPDLRDIMPPLSHTSGAGVCGESRPRHAKCDRIFCLSEYSRRNSCRLFASGGCHWALYLLSQTRQELSHGSGRESLSGFGRSVPFFVELRRNLRNRQPLLAQLADPFQHLPVVAQRIVPRHRTHDCVIGREAATPNHCHIGSFTVGPYMDNDTFHQTGARSLCGRWLASGQNARASGCRRPKPESGLFRRR